MYLLYVYIILTMCVVHPFPGCSLFFVALTTSVLFGGHIHLSSLIQFDGTTSTSFVFLKNNNMIHGLWKTKEQFTDYEACLLKKSFKTFSGQPWVDSVRRKYFLIKNAESTQYVEQILCKGFIKTIYSIVLQRTSHLEKCLQFKVY